MVINVANVAGRFSRWSRGMWGEDVFLKRDRPPYGPINTYTNAVYPILGAISGDWLFFAAMLLLGIGSAAYHRWKEHWGEMLDDCGMWAVLAYFILGGAWVGVLFAALLGVVNWMPDFRNRQVSHRAIIKVVFALVVLHIGLASWPALLLFGIAYWLWKLDKKTARYIKELFWYDVPWYSRLCHGTWHILTGIGFYALYLVH